MTGSSALPHRAETEALIGLVRDGVVFAKSGGKARGGSGGATARAPLLDKGANKGADKKTEPSKKSSGGSKEKEKKEKDCGSRERSSGKPKGSKSKDGEKKGGKGGAEVDSVASASSGADAEVTAALPGTVAGGGGRWVHVPT